MTLCKTHCISQAPLLHPNPGVSPFCPRALRFSCRNPQNFRNGGGRSYTQLVRHSCAAQSRGRRGWRTNFDSSAGSSSGTVLGSGTRPLPGEQSPRPRSPLPLTPLLVFLSRFGGLRPPLPPFPPSPSSLDADRWSPPPPFSLARSLAQGVPALVPAQQDRPEARGLQREGRAHPFRLYPVGQGGVR